MPRQPYVDLICAVNEVIVAWGKASIRAAVENRDECSVILPIPPGTVDVDALVEMVGRLEFVKRVEPFEWLRDQPGVAAITEPADAVTLLMPGIRVVCHTTMEAREVA